MSRTTEELNKALKNRCIELENLLTSVRGELEETKNSKARTEFLMTPVVNPKNGKVELYSVVYIISDNNVIPMIRRGTPSNDDNTISWVNMTDIHETK
mgnify:CR=1 FL=1|tara:strand:+ start:20 stop:313 length:294 start_codon:yes stop_codon:yes gene_type:complete